MYCLKSYNLNRAAKTHRTIEESLKGGLGCPIISGIVLPILAAAKVETLRVE